jgi:3-methyladenine DNA glycosylase AlkD
MLNMIKWELLQLSNPDHAKRLAGFFKTEKGQYGEGDLFLGIRVPEQRKVAKKYTKLGLNDIQELLNSKFHEHRFTALVILISKYLKAEESCKEEIFRFILKNTANINNWDLVDLSAPKIIGDYLVDKDKSILYELAKSENLWERRISILATFKFIADNDFIDALKISEILLKDKHDLIHKAVGWALREIGKRNQRIEEQFLNKHATKMPRTMLRYAIEKFEEKKRKSYLTKKQATKSY